MKACGDAQSDASRLAIHTSWGVIHVRAAGGAITSCRLPHLVAEPSRPFRWLRSSVRAGTEADRSVLKEAARFMRDAMGGRWRETPPFTWPAAPPFTIRVWRALRTIPVGATMEYGELARRIGRVRGARAVGRACGANPLPVFIPCHRVLPRDGTLGGFSSGLPWKRLLLEGERREGRVPGWGGEG